MITNVPAHQDFEIVSKQCFIQAFNMLYKVYEQLKESNVYDFEDDFVIEDTWLHNVGTIRTSLILIHQGIETYMKSVIAEKTPLLLIAKNSTEWPTLPESGDKDFDTLYTISGEALLHTFCAVLPNGSVDTKMIEFIESIRLKRNKAIHGASEITETPKQLVDNILKAYTYFWGKGNWFIDIKEFNVKSPSFGYMGDSEYEQVLSFKFLDFVKSILGKKKMQEYCKNNISSREYFCPDCKRIVGIDIESKWAFLEPNKPKSESIYCINCDKNFKVRRNDCIEEGCKGNVIFHNDEESVDICLTCYNYEPDII